MTNPEALGPLRRGHLFDIVHHRSNTIGRHQQTATKIGDLTKFKHTDFHAIHSSLATQSFVDYTHSPEVNRSVAAWTLNDARLLSLMISRGVDNLITDHPALARRVLEEMKAMRGPEQFVLEISHRLGLGVDPPPAPASGNQAAVEQ